jgi:hypothetical protein
VQGATRRVSVWVVTQLQDPVRLFLPPSPSIFSNGYQLGSAPKGVGITNGVISLSRDAVPVPRLAMMRAHCFWVGEQSVLLIESPRIPGLARSAYPGQRMQR